MFFGPEKWMAISAVNLAWLRDPHDLQGIGTSHRPEVFTFDAFHSRDGYNKNVDWRLFYYFLDSRLVAGVI